MKGFRVLLVAGALVALAPSAHALTKAAPEAVAELGRAISAGTVPEMATALETLKAAGFEAGAARAVFNTLRAPGNKAKVSGVNWDAFANAAKELSPAALSSVVAKLDVVNDGEALLAEVRSVQQVSTSASAAAGPAAAQDYEQVFEQHTSTIAGVNTAFAALKASDLSVDRAAKKSIGHALVLGTTQFPNTCSAGKKEHCKVVGAEVAGLWGAMGLAKAGDKADKFLKQGVFTAFANEPVNYVGHGEIIGDGAKRSLLQGDQMSPTLQSCWRNGVPLTVNP